MKKLFFTLILVGFWGILNSQIEKPKKRKSVNKNIPIRNVFKTDTTIYDTPTYEKNRWLITTNRITGKRDTIASVN